jgi:hypothetical protein
VIARGEGWGEPTADPAEVTVRGGDVDLARAIGEHPGARLAFVPDASSDFARAVGLAAGGSPRSSAVALPIDAVELDDGTTVVNAVVLGAPPAQIGWATLGTGVRVAVDGRTVFEGRATTVVIANGQYLDGDDVVPRGHPGDGRLEVQVYAVERGDRRAMRRRLASGEHVPHPGITQAVGKTVEVRAPSRLPVVADGRHHGSLEELRAKIRPAACTLVI